jgi:hypothetical protein
MSDLGKLRVSPQRDIHTLLAPSLAMDLIPKLRPPSLNSHSSVIHLKPHNILYFRTNHLNYYQLRIFLIQGLV